MSKLDQKPMQRAQLGMTSHNLSHTFDFTSSTGMILPLVTDILNPGEKIETIIDLSDTRTQPMQSAAYLDLDMHVDYFFVPMTMLLSKFESFIYRIKDFYSSTENYNFDLPLMDLDLAKAAARTYMSTYPFPNSMDFDQLGKGICRLFDHLKYGNLFNNQDDSSRFGNPNYAYNPKVFPWAVLAYQAAYQYYFINDEFEVFANYSFNVDNCVNTNTDIGADTFGYLPRIQLRYRNKYHDYFTSLKASPIVSGKNLLDSAGSLSLAKSWLSRSGSYYGSPLHGNPTLIDGFAGNDNALGSPDSVNTQDVRTNFGFTAGKMDNGGSYINVTNSLSNGSDINTANLRALFANEKLWTITGMNRKQYDAQTLAHFGFDVPTDVMHQVQHIGHHLYNLRVGEVISTAGTATQPLATVAGKGYAFQNPENKPLRFTAPCHGVFIAVYSSAIRRNYFNTFGKENAVASWQDFYQPEFDHLGMQPLFGFEAAQDGLMGTSWTNLSNPYANIFGWQYRYEQFKRKYDRATLAFGNSIFGSNFVYFVAPFGTWSAADVPLQNLLEDQTVDSFSPSGVYLADLKEDPCELNNLMQIAYDPLWHNGDGQDPLNYVQDPWNLYQTDPLIHHSLIHYTKLSTMSSYSMPRLDS